MSRKKPPRIALDLPGMIGMNEVFRVSGGIKHDPAVDAWLAGDPVELRSMARKWFERMRRCGDDVVELIHDGCPFACIDDAPFGYVNAFKDHVNVGFFNGAFLDDPAHLLEGSGKCMRHVKLYPGRQINTAALGDLIDAAYVYIKLRLGKSESPK